MQQDLNSHVVLKKEDGSNTTFNFKFENGLPVKPIIECEYSVGYSKKNNCYVIAIYLNENNIQKLKPFNVDKVAYNNSEIWLLINENYIALNQLEDKIIYEYKNKELGFYFYDNKNNFICGKKLSE